ncbi:unnamed protein product, partial [Ectocarpus sp. 12 AP-2014]
MASINTTSNNATNNETMDSSNNSTLYKATARNLCEYHGVPSMTADNLEKTMVLLRLRPGRLVVQGLAPKKLLEGSAAADADADTTDSSGSSGSSGSEVEPEQADDNQVSDDSNSNSSDSGDTENDNIRKHDRFGVETKTTKHPVHAALVAAGITLRPRETRPLLRALGVGPHRLVKLGLVQREELRRSRPAGRRGGPPPHLRHGHPGGPGGRGHHHHRGGRGMGRPRGPPPHGPPPQRHVHGHGKRPAHRDHRHTSGPVHAPRPGPFQESGRSLYHGPGHHLHHGGVESEREEDEMAMIHAGPRGPPHGIPPPPHLRGQHGGRHPHGMPMHDRAMHLHHRPGHHHHRDDVESSGSEEEDGTEMGMGPRAHPPPHGHPRRDGGRDGHSGHHGKSHLDSDGD